MKTTNLLKSYQDYKQKPSIQAKPLLVPTQQNKEHPDKSLAYFPFQRPNTYLFCERETVGYSLVQMEKEEPLTTCKVSKIK